MRLWKTAIALLGTLVLTQGKASANAISQAFSFSSATFQTFDNASAELGYDFTTGANAIEVAALGYINDGFNGTHTISIFDVANETLVPGATAVVTTVGGGSTSNSFTYTDLAKPVFLAANTEYQIVSQFYDTEHYFTNAKRLTSAEGLSIGNAVYDDYNNLPSTPTFAQGQAPGNDPGDFGPNFEVVPEPSAMLLLGASLIILFASRGRKQVTLWPADKVNGKVRFPSFVKVQQAAN